uniref:Uncharacterized protein n=1 Tax=Glossina pallidipes TaxID=7398 RepID=A0A1A9ZFS0_GLOPL
MIRVSWVVSQQRTSLTKYLRSNDIRQYSNTCPCCEHVLFTRSPERVVEKDVDISGPLFPHNALNPLSQQINTMVTSISQHFTSQPVQNSAFQLGVDKGGYGAKAAAVRELRGLLRRDPRPKLPPEKRNSRTGLDKDYEVEPWPTLILATKVESVAELKAECERAEKLLKESRARPRHVNEVEQEVKTIDEARKQTVEALAPRHDQANNKQLQERRQFQPTMLRAGQLQRQSGQHQNNIVPGKGQGSL